jgi:general secretion pathway protein G
VKLASEGWHNLICGRKSGRGGERGFTILELMIVITIIMILATIAVGQYQKSLLHTRETVLRQDLFVMREAIDQFTMDKNAAPQGLDDLQQAGYLKGIPKDPFTHASDWATDTCDTLMSPDQTTTGICDVHSIAPGSSPFEGTPYNSW